MSAGVNPSLFEALAEVGGRYPPERVDRVWLFPPRQLGGAESSLAVLSLFDPTDPAARREIVTLHCTATVVRGRTERSAEVIEQGSAPAELVEKVIHGVLLRLNDDREVPRSEAVTGDPDRWSALLEGRASVS